MSRGPRSSGGDSWRPVATLDTLRRRAELLSRIRAFFAEREVLEVETPLLGAAAATDPRLTSLSCRVTVPEPRTAYLQTSPEAAMKRLLASGSGSIFQITRAFRDGERGRLHNPEFTILEWYRVGFDHHALIDEVDALLSATLGVPAGERRSYAEVFGDRFGLDPHRAGVAELRAAAAAAGIEPRGMVGAPRDSWLQLLLALRIEPDLGRGRPTYLVDFPASQAALARVRRGDPPVAERFEAYVEGVELANGFHELTDAVEQGRRFDAELESRRREGLPEVPGDRRLLASLAAGLPPCAGVALGLDRLLMLACGASSIDDVLAFPFERA